MSCLALCPRVFFFFFFFFSVLFSIVITSLWKKELVYMYVLLVHLHAYIFCFFSLHLDVRNWLWLVIVALPGLFYELKVNILSGEFSRNTESIQSSSESGLTQFDWAFSWDLPETKKKKKKKKNSKIIHAFQKPLVKRAPLKKQYVEPNSQTNDQSMQK